MEIINTPLKLDAEKLAAVEYKAASEPIVICRKCNQIVYDEIQLDLDATGTSAIHAVCPVYFPDKLFLHGPLKAGS